MKCFFGVHKWSARYWYAHPNVASPTVCLRYCHKCHVVNECQ
jgi:hypothetical protein